MAKKDPGGRAALEALALVGQLGLVAILSFGVAFGAGWALDRWLNATFFKWVGLLLGVVALYWNAARLLRDFLKTSERK